MLIIYVLTMDIFYENFKNTCFTVISCTLATHFLEATIYFLLFDTPFDFLKLYLSIISCLFFFIDFEKRRNGIFMMFLVCLIANDFFSQLNCVIEFLKSNELKTAIFFTDFFIKTLYLACLFYQLFLAVKCVGFVCFSRTFEKAIRLPLYSSGFKNLNPPPVY